MVSTTPKRAAESAFHSTPSSPRSVQLHRRGSARATVLGLSSTTAAAPQPPSSSSPMRSFYRTGARIDPRVNEISAFNALKKRAMLLMVEDIQISTNLLTPEMFVRAEDDFLRYTKGRKNRILYLSDVQEDLRLVGHALSTKRLETLLSGHRNAGKGISFLDLLHHTFPNVSTAATDALALKYSTSLNPLLGGTLVQRMCPETYHAIRSLFNTFDLDGDGVVHRRDIQELRQRHQDRRGGGSGHGYGEEQMLLLESEAALDRSVNALCFPNEEVSLDDFAHFVRFLFPPYKAMS